MSFGLPSSSSSSSRPPSFTISNIREPSEVVSNADYHALGEFWRRLLRAHGVILFPDLTVPPTSTPTPATVEDEEMPETADPRTVVVRMNVGRVTATNSTRSRSEPRKVSIRRAEFQYEEPLREITYDPGFNCVVPVRVGSQQFRMCVDTGGARSMINKKFREKLAKHPKTCQAMQERCHIGHEVKCTGICDGMTSTKLEYVSTVRLTLDGVTDDGSRPPKPVDIDVEMGELEGSTDNLLMGFPDIVRLAVKFYEDADGNVWVEFEKLGITLLADSPTAGQ